MKGAHVVPDEPNAEHWLAAGQLVAEELALDCVLADVVRELDNRGIESLLLKGPALARWLYDDQSQRPYGDIDLMVEPAQFDRAERCLEEIGFTPAETTHERADHHENWVSPGRYPAQLELHRTLFLLTVPPELVWQRLNSGHETISVAGMPVAVPDVAARALIVALHAAQHGRRATTPVEDLEQAIRRGSLPVWKRAAALARELRCLPAFSAGLRLSPQGAELARQLGIAAERTSRSLRLSTATAPDTATGIDTLLITSGFLPRLRFIGRELVPSRSFMRATYPLAKRGRAGLIGAYLMRPIYLAVALPRGLVAWLRAAVPPR
jgi:hypothetical protein